MLYNCGGIFLYYHFFVGYILSFGLVRLRTIRLSARVGPHIERWCSCSRWEDVTITDFIITTPDRNGTGGCEWCHSRRQWAEDFGWFLKKSSELRFEPRRSELNFWTWARPVQWGLRDAPLVVGSDRTVSIVKIVSLSPCVENVKAKKKLIKVSYLN